VLVPRPLSHWWFLRNGLLFFFFPSDQGEGKKQKNNFFIKGGSIMKVTDAAQILGLAGQITPDDVKAAYREAARRYHPDVNPESSPNRGLEIEKKGEEK
jgi:hypothetical protein